METKILTLLALACLVAQGIKVVIAEVASIMELWCRLRGKGGPEMTAFTQHVTNEPGLGNWFVVYVEPSREQISATLLTEKGYEVFLPKYRKVFTRQGLRREIDLPLFTRYVFCRLTRTATAQVIGTPGVVKLIGFRDGKGLLEDTEIQMLRRLESAGASPFSGHLEAGTRVRIKHGPLMGIKGMLQKRKGGSNKVVISIDMLVQSVAVEVNEDALERI